MKYVKMYSIALVFFSIIDAIWFGLIAKSIYKKEIGNLLANNLNWFAAIIFYLLFTLGLVFFVIKPSIEKESIKYLLISGILFGLIIYSTYDLTNFVTLKNWSINITIIDLLWGSFVSTSVSYITYNIYLLKGKK